MRLLCCLTTQFQTHKWLKVCRIYIIFIESSDHMDDRRHINNTSTDTLNLKEFCRVLMGWLGWCIDMHMRLWTQLLEGNRSCLECWARYNLDIDIKRSILIKKLNKTDATEIVQGTCRFLHTDCEAIHTKRRNDSIISSSLPLHRHKAKFID